MNQLSTAVSKAHTTAICIIPPRSAWEQIQRVRCFNDKSFLRWPPHVNLLYPFLKDEEATLQDAASTARKALNSFEPFQVTLQKLAYFDHRHSCTLWLDPKAPQLLDLQEALQASFPMCTDLTSDPSRGIKAFQPHLSLGQWKIDSMRPALEDLQADWEPLTFTASSVAIISRRGFSEPFRIRYHIPIGSTNSQVEEVNIPYVATVNAETPSKHAWASQYGVGALTDGCVWYFGFGANMSMKKLSGSRGIKPLESLRAKMTGWELTFNHRGAMGNISQLGDRQVGSSGLDSVHGVLHKLNAADFAQLTTMEHEYRPTEVLVERYDGGEPVCAVTFISPPNRLIRRDLPPTSRYADLLRTGVHEFQLDERYCSWLDSLPTVSSESKRGEEYWQSPEGEPLKMFPRIWTGSEDAKSSGRRGGRGQRDGRSQRQNGENEAQAGASSKEGFQDQRREPGGHWRRGGRGGRGRGSYGRRGLRGDHSSASGNGHARGAGRQDGSQSSEPHWQTGRSENGHVQGSYRGGRGRDGQDAGRSLAGQGAE